MNDKRYEMYLKRVQARREAVIKEVEKNTWGDADKLLPALFTVDIEKLSPEHILTLEMGIDLFWTGHDCGREH